MIRDAAGNLYGTARDGGVLAVAGASIAASTLFAVLIAWNATAVIEAPGVVLPSETLVHGIEWEGPSRVMTLSVKFS